MSLILSGTDGLSDVDGTAATPAIRGTDANTGIFFGTDIIGFSEGGVEAARFDSLGNFGVGTTSTPTGSSAFSRFITVAGSNDGVLQLTRTSATAGGGAIASAAGAGMLFYTHTGTVGSETYTERARFNSTGALVFAGGTTTANGIGITFPATQSASSNANTLDDYEEGTWTPTITAYAGSVTAYTSQGSYVKIGRIVFATVYAVVSNAGTASGAYIISNLPFSLATSAEVYGYGVNLLTNVGLVAYGSGSTSLYCFTAAGAFPGGSGTYVTLNFNYSV